MPTAYIIDPRDNVATLLEACGAGETLQLLGESATTLVAIENIRPEHKVALVDIAAGDPVVKYGMPIGRATQPITAGQPVHLHNCSSNYDERSNSLDADTGAPSDTPYV